MRTVLVWLQGLGYFVLAVIIIALFMAVWMIGSILFSVLGTIILIWITAMLIREGLKH